QSRFEVSENDRNMAKSANSRQNHLLKSSCCLRLLAHVVQEAIFQFGSRWLNWDCFRPAVNPRLLRSSWIT
ncbi:hypothetical protein L9F63_006224, partial [Diploptera punctata]